MPKDKKLRLEVFKLYYDILVAGHRRRKLMINEVLEKVGTHLMVEFITKLLLVAEKDVILVVYDRLSKITHFVANTEGISAEELARLFRDNVWKLYRLLESVMSDRKP